jgi:serine/threonine protein kinase/tetratricopeptide (TPR) repeat protein
VSAEYGKNEEAIFNEAIKIKSSAERAAFVKSACGDDTALLARVEAMLKVHFEDESFLKSPPAGIAGTLDASPLTEGPGTRIGRYKLLQLIGEGGFGVVYMAEQEEPIRRKVALKIIKLGMDTKQVIARFEAERQALAMMDHPNIARVFDAGATDTGRPYFVMELVKGISITEYCDKNDLDTQKRLELFIDVCKAVQHAHQKGIIHRDIKPSNVMITLHDGKPVPKIIDFGIAKATQQRLTEKTLFTEYRQFIGTPEYISPEQAEMSGLDVDTRTDIYSLGVLLYELLTGTTPFEADKLRSAAYDEIRRIIREDEPPRPSTRLSTLGDALTDIAKHRDAQPGELRKIVHGDLDWIVMKTLEKDRTRRYETASEFALDIRRHLSDEPVVASPPSATYRIKKFVRRNRASVTGVAAVLVVLITGIVVSTMFAIGQSRARAEAQAVADFLKNDVLASVDPEKAKGREITVRYILDAAAEKIDKKLEGMPLVEASIRQTLGITYYSLGKYKSAETHLERARQIRRERLGDEDPDTLDSMGELGWCYLLQGRYDKAEQLLVKVLQIRRRVLGEEDKSTLTSMHFLGWVYLEQGRYDEAEPLLVKALEGRRRVLGQEHADTLGTMNNLALLYTDQGRYDEAEQLLVKTLEVMRRVLGQEAPFTLNSMVNLAVLYKDQERYDEAEQLQVKALGLMRRVLGQEHPYTLKSMGNLALLYAEQKRYDEAERLLIENLEIHRRVLGEEHPDTLRSMNNLANVYRNQGRYDEAEALYVERLEILRRVLGEEHRDALETMGDLAKFYAEQKRYNKAERLYIENMEIQHRVLGQEHPDTVGCMNKLIELYEAWGKPEKAEQLREELPRKEDTK